MLYRTLKTVITNGIKKGNLDVEDMANKLDVFWAVGKLSEAEYNELTAMLAE